MKVINEAYFASYTRELRAGVVKDLVFSKVGSRFQHLRQAYLFGR
jgi:hypothetical protein